MGRCLCEERLSRRQFLRVSLAAAIGAHLNPRLVSAGAERGAEKKSVILLYMNGGPCHLDTFDPKPGTAVGGPFRAIHTRIPGVKFTEHLPGLARRADELVVIRSLRCKEGSHQRARFLMHTGYSPVATTRHPCLGATVSHEAGDPRGDLPNYVTLGGPGEGAGFFGAEHAPFVVQSKPGDPVQNMQRWHDVDDARLDARLELLGRLDAGFGLRGGKSEAEAHQAMLGRARRMMKSPAAKAFELSEESPEVTKAYGESEFGKRCLMARRLVEAGVRCVEVELSGWDTHEDNFTGHQKLMEHLDPVMAALLDDLKSRDLLRRTLVMWIGDFGRSPRINPREGRDHHPQCFSGVLAGAGIRGGTVIGSTTDDGEKVQDRPVEIPDLFATVLTILGIDPTREYTSADRPLALANKGKILEEIL